MNTIAQALDGSESIDLDELSRAYSVVANGFYGTYGGIETALGLITPEVLPAPGPAAEPEALGALDQAIELALGGDVLSMADLDGAVGVCLCQVSAKTDGASLRRAYFGTDVPDPDLAAAHRASAAVLTRAVHGQPVDDNIDLMMDRLCCFTSDLPQILGGANLDHAMRWRGALLRNWSVWAWRLLWANLVAPLSGTGTREDAVAVFVAGLPSVRVRQALRDDLPPTVDGNSGLQPVEHDLNDEVGQAGGWSVLQLLRLLAVGARRADEVDGLSREAFLRYDQTGMGPVWFRGWIDDHADIPLPDAARSLAIAMFNRAEKVSRDKMQWTRTGLRMPTRLRVVGDRLRLEGREGDAPASLRLDTFASVLLQLGVLDVSDDGMTWKQGPYGTEWSPGS